MVPLNKDNQEDICPICLDPPKEAVSTDCRHRFCRTCLTQHMDKASVSGALRCPVCRKPCSEGVLGDNYICCSHQKKVCRFCEASRHLLCVECLMSPEHQSHTELSIENAISHYKVDWGRHRLRTGQQNQDQTKEWLKALPWHWLDQQEDLPVEVAKTPTFSEAVTQLSILVSSLERMAKELDASTLKDASDLLDRYDPLSLCPTLEDTCRPTWHRCVYGLS
ncbi:E3 ubiquitin ligase TRIM40 isoform X2 [Meriones unguiculatus]|uniref:E3 ubiquitin ligase TRIM40 isoform X2 n=1 Tax=Meriones unguiculatus TaxID=10047 RepID=UPI00293F2E0B|nr:E3 ubiquitin ligase TRIM40 isoform X2 [Meriones unguiculatus]